MSLKKSLLWVFSFAFLLSIQAKTENTPLQERVLNMKNLSKKETKELLNNYEDNKNELLTTLTKNLIDFIENNYPNAYTNPKQLAAIFIAYRMVFWTTAMIPASEYADQNTAMNDEWHKAKNAINAIPSSPAMDAAWYAASRERNLNLAENKVRAPLVGLYPSKGQAGWRLSELFVLALTGQEKGDFIREYFADAYKTAKKSLSGKPLPLIKDFMANKAIHTWEKPPEENKEPLAHNPYIQSLMFILDPVGTLTSERKERLDEEMMLKINPFPKPKVKGAQSCDSDNC